MYKQLHRLGNSIAFVIDKPTRRLLGIGRNTKLRVTTDGRRLVIEPITEQPPAPTASELDARGVFMTLVDRFCMSQSQFEQLHHARMRMFAYDGWLKVGPTATVTDAESKTFRRFEACLRALQRGASWDDAITVALHTEPKDGEPINVPREAPREPLDTVLDPEPDPMFQQVDESLYAEEDEGENPPEGVWVPT
jgi:hypothetical protein